MSSRKDLYNQLSGVKNYDPTAKDYNIRMLVDGFLNKTLTMFLYEGLPDSLPYIEIEKVLQINGVGFITEYNKQLVILPITLLYDEVDVYGNAIRGTVYYADRKTYEQVNLSDGVLIYNDFLGMGLLDIFKKYSYLINESDITLNIANLWKRTEKVFNANDDPTAESVKAYFNKVLDGELGVIVSNLLYNSLNVHSNNVSGVSIHELIEYNNYIKSQFYHEIGLYSNDNMKKERLITSEVETGLNSIYPLVDNMFNSRLQAVEQINKRYNLDISIEFTSSWEYRFNLGENLKKEELNDNADL